MSSVGYVVLAHDNIFRLRQVIKRLLDQGAPVSLHIDAKTPAHRVEALRYFFKNEKRLYWVKRIQCDWGEWSIVQAQINSTRLLMKKEPELKYIYHISGACLPLRPHSELEDFLDDNEQPRDYIEAVAIGEGKWVVDGLDAERTELYHPFNWQNQRKLFDLNVKLQRAIKFKRKLPEGLTICMGSQWWCLSTNTLKRIFNDPQFEEYARFFTKSWIPDESFFQSLARKHSPRIDMRSLTYVTFDNDGKPFLIYDDHIDILDRLDRFFIRKIWRGADQLYTHFLNPKREIKPRDQFAEAEIMALLNHAKESCAHGRPGVLSQFSLPMDDRLTTTRAPYMVYVGFNAVRDQIYEHYYKSPTIKQLGYLFHPSRTEFGLSKHRTPKNAPDLFKLRDYHKLQFLTQRVWYAYPRNIAFMAKPHHLNNLDMHMAFDKNANILMIKGAWLLDLFRRKIENVERLRTICQIEMRREDRLLKAISKSSLATTEFFELKDLFLSPQIIAEHFPDQFELSPPELDYDKFMRFVSRLKNNGISLTKYQIPERDLVKNSQNDAKIISLSEYAQARNL